jgi:hypothetical protein
MDVALRGGCSPTRVFMDEAGVVHSGYTMVARTGPLTLSKDREVGDWKQPDSTPAQTLVIHLD